MYVCGAPEPEYKRLNARVRRGPGRKWVGSSADVVQTLHSLVKSAETAGATCWSHARPETEVSLRDHGRPGVVSCVYAAGPEPE